MLKTKRNQSRRSTIDLSSVVKAIGNATWEYDAATTRKMIIERVSKGTGNREVITFSQAYGELSAWLGQSFANISEFGFSDMLAAEFFQGAEFHTKRAEYRFWNRGHFQNQQ